MSTARVVVDDHIASLYVPFALKDVVKTLPGRRWDKARKCWLVSTVFVDEAANALRAAGCTVFVTRADGSAWTSGRAGAGHRATPGADWAESLLDAVGPAQAEAVFKALTRVLHPDAGGDHVLMSQLNEARRKVAAGE